MQSCRLSISGWCPSEGMDLCHVEVQPVEWMWTSKRIEHCLEAVAKKTKTKWSCVFQLLTMFDICFVDFLFCFAFTIASHVRCLLRPFHRKVNRLFWPLLSYYSRVHKNQLQACGLIWQGIFSELPIIWTTQTHTRNVAMATQSPDDLKKPQNFSWVIDDLLCACAYPGTSANLRYLRSQGVNCIVNLTAKDDLPAEAVQGE